MAAANAPSASSSGSERPSAARGPEGLPSAGAGASEESTKVQKRYETLVAVRSRAVKGKGAWYWSYLDPVLLLDPATALPSAVKLRCSLCLAAFSSSNPSRTASEHLKRGTCPSFTNHRSSAAARPISDQPSSPQHRHYQAPQSSHRFRKRGQASSPPPPSPPPSHQISPLAPSSSSTPPPPPHGHLSLHLMTSGGKEDLGALAMLEDSVKRLKNLGAPASPALSKTQVESAVSLLSDWVHESCGAVSFSAVEHPKFRAFLHHVGLPPVSRRELAGARLDARYEDARLESDARIRDAPFFQMASDGWKKPNGADQQGLVKLAVNLPDGTTVFRKAVFTNVDGKVEPKYAEETLRDAITSICGGEVQRCAGIVADGFKATALRNLENQHKWMVNLLCQLRGLHSLVKDFAHGLPLFRAAAGDCSRLAHFFNTNATARSLFHKYQLQEHDAHAGLLRAIPSPPPPRSNFASVLAMMEDVVGSGRALKMSVLDESYNADDIPVARELGKMVQTEAFWNNLAAALALVKVVGAMAEEVEAERPLVGQCLPLWEELRGKVREWCTGFGVDPGPVEGVVDRRFKKSYRPALSAAFVLDPVYLARDAATGKYVPPFGRLTPAQEEDVERVITRLLPRPEEARVALTELVKWRAEGLDPLYAQAVQVKQRDPATGKMRVANPAGRRLVWETCLGELRALGKVAVRLIFLHATAGGFRCNASLLRWVHTHRRSRAAMDRAQKLVFVAAQARLERRDLSSEEEQDAELFADADDDDDDDDVLDDDTAGA